MTTIKTLADYIDKHMSDSRYITPRRERMKAIVIDGQPLGTYELDFEHDKERAKRFMELQWLAISLVGCDADLELKEMRFLAPRHGKATPDFEATTRANGIIRVELCRVVDEDDRKVLNALAGLGSATQRRLDETTRHSVKGEYFVRFFDGSNPQWSDIRGASEELANLIETDTRLQIISRTFLAAGPEYPKLHSLRAHVAHIKADGPTRIVLDGPVSQSDPVKAMAIFADNFAEKKAKYGDYSDGHPVWLVFIAQSYTQRFIAGSFVEHLKTVDTFDPRPFDRVLLGCFTIGVTFDRPYAIPRYTGLTAAG